MAIYLPMVERRRVSECVVTVLSASKIRCLKFMRSNSLLGGRYQAS